MFLEILFKYTSRVLHPFNPLQWVVPPLIHTPTPVMYPAACIDLQSTSCAQQHFTQGFQVNGSSKGVDCGLEGGVEGPHHVNEVLLLLRLKSMVLLCTIDVHFVLGFGLWRLEWASQDCNLHRIPQQLVVLLTQMRLDDEKHRNMRLPNVPLKMSTEPFIDG
jgi:hypothetical protein